MALKVKKNIDKDSEKLEKELEKVSKEVDKKKSNDKKKEVKKDEKKVVKKESWWQGVKSEFKKVRWPNKKEMVKYSIATICFIIFFAVFFWIIEMIAYLIKTM